MSVDKHVPKNRYLRKNDDISRKGRAIFEDYTVFSESLQFTLFYLDLPRDDVLGASNIEP